MKKITFLAAAAAVCALCMAGCNNDIEEPALPATGKQVTMTVQASAAAPRTRADYTEEGDVMKFSWRSDDAISVVVNGVTGNENCQLTTTEDANKASFSGTVTSWSGEKDIYTFYPYSAAGYTVTGGDTPETATVKFTLPDEQTYNASTHAATNGFMVGSGKASADDTGITASVGMKQVMSFVKLNITNAPAKVASVKLKCNEAVFATKATVKLSDATISGLTTKAKELAMKVIYDDEGTAKEGTTEEVSIAMLPDNLSNKTIQVEIVFEDGKMKTIEKSGMNFERNKHYEVDFDATDAAAPILPAMSFVIDLTNYPQKTFSLPFGNYINTGNYTLTVNWGDGQTTTINPQTYIDLDGEILIHTYPEQKEYTITITSTEQDYTQAQIPVFKPGYLRTKNNNAEKLKSLTTALLNMGTDDLSYCFNDCTNLTTIPTGLFDNNKSVKNFSYCFSNCKSLTEIPERLFDNNADATDFSNCFNSCTTITEIPKGLFDNNKSVTNFKNCFNNCAITKIPEALFDNNKSVTDFSGCFRYCTTITEIPERLFDNNVSVTDFSYCFNICTSLTKIPEGLFSNNTNATSFSNCFYKCTSLTTISEGLFGNNTNATSFSYCFSNCSKLKLNANIFCIETTAKETRFAEVTSIDFKGCFKLAGSSLTTDAGTAPALWEYTFKQGVTPQSSDCFNGCNMSNASAMTPDQKLIWGTPKE